jgi:tetratricopeptide (TPR) repeat protein
MVHAVRLHPLLAAFLLIALPIQAVEIEAARKLFITGSYSEAIAAAREGMREHANAPEWPLLLGQSLSAVGRYAEARDALTQAISEYPGDLSLRLAQYRALLDTGAADEARAQLTEMDRIGGTRQWAYRTPAERIALGRVALMVGGDPKRVIDLFFDPVKKEAPEFRDVYLANGDLALEKNDFALAAKAFQAAAKKFPEDPDAWFGVARAFAPSDSEATEAAIEKALKFNPHHVGAYLLLADGHIDAEHYDEAAKAIAAALKVNPHTAEAHAYRAVLAHLRADDAAEKAARVAAMRNWKTNPGVPHLIGRKLSQKYRFAEGATEQREALRFDPTFLPAKAQLAHDLLRLGGHDDEAWTLAEEVTKADPYDVVAFNLVTLRDAIAHFRTLESAHFTVKMDPREADIYGADVLALLERAHTTLTAKYGLTLRDKTIVEIFPDQKDFAIRTFGLPGGAGYLGVCFGRVITANSPAARPGSPSSWEAVLWHEFCHVVTLTATKNKMPRWLSEGISVFEERQARGSWGEQMKPRYRAMILGEDLTPVSELSAAFLNPKTPMHLGFAYYESSLVVEWLVGKWGVETMKRLLADLGRGIAINAALATHFAPMEKLDADFAAHAQALAKNVGPKLDWTKPDRRQMASEGAVEKFIAENPNNFDALLAQADRLLEAGEWQAAKAPLQKLIELYPAQHDADSAYSRLARAHRELGETAAETAVLERLADLAADATEAFQRLMELAVARQDWPAVLDYAARYHAVDPLRPEPHRLEAEALEALGQRPPAIAAYRTLLKLGPADPAAVHYRLARLLHAERDPGAKREVLLALEEAPRFREAHALLLEIVGGL